LTRAEGTPGPQGPGGLLAGRATEAAEAVARGETGDRDVFQRERADFVASVLRQG